MENLDITNISEKEKMYLYSVVNDNENLKNFFCKVSSTYDKIRKSEEEELQKIDLEKEILKEKMQEIIEQIVFSGVLVDLYPENKFNSHPWNQYYLSCVDEKVIFFNDFCFLFEDIYYLIDFVNKNKNCITEPTPIFPTEKKYLLELEDKKAIIEWEKKLSKKDTKIQKRYNMLPKSLKKGTYHIHKDTSSLNYCREILKDLNEYQIMVDKLKKFKFNQLTLISEYFQLVEELRNLDFRKENEEDKNSKKNDRWEMTYEKLLQQKETTKEFEYAQLILFKNLLKLRVYNNLPEFKSYNRYCFNIEAINSFLELNKEKFENILVSTFDDSKIDEVIKVKLKTF